MCSGWDGPIKVVRMGGGDIRGGVEIYECSSWSDNCFSRVSSDKCCIYINAHISTVYMCYAQET